MPGEDKFNDSSMNLSHSPWQRDLNVHVMLNEINMCNLKIVYTRKIGEKTLK